MPKFAANLSMQFIQHDFPVRFDAAAAGYRGGRRYARGLTGPTTR